MRLLEKYVATPRPVKADAGVAESLRRWEQINGFSDVRLWPLLKELKNKPHMATSLRPTVSKDIREWIAKAMPRIASMKSAELRALGKFVDEVSAIDAFNIEEIESLRNVLFGLRYRETSRHIYNALDSWDLNKAWELFEALSHAPEGFEKSVKELQDEIFKVGDLQADVAAFLNQLSKREPETWLEMRTLVDSLQKLQDYLSYPNIPAEWRSRLEQEADGCVSSAEAFLRKQATAIASIENLRAFWAEYERLSAVKANGRLSLNEEWFQTCLDLVISSESDRVVRATNPQELRANSSRIMEDSQRLPPFATSLMQSLADEIARMAADWRSMLDGNNFKAPSSHQGRLPIPKLLTSESPRFRQFLSQLDEALARIKGSDGAPAKAVYETALRVAQDVLSQIPEHRRASELKSDAEHGLLYGQLDAALAVFNIEGFLSLSRSNRVEGIYDYLMNQPDNLHNLAALASQAAFPTWREAAAWWSQWRATYKMLQQTTAIPDALENAIQAHEALRRDQWYGVLDRLVKREAPPEETVAAAESLAEELESLSLQGYYNELMRKAMAARVRRYIDEKDFDQAREKLAGLEQGHPDTLRLRTRLMVEEAAKAGTRAMAEVLRNSWNNVVAEYGDAAYGMLLITVKKAWQDQDGDSLKHLRMAISRAAANPRAPATDLEALQQWGGWLRVEGAITAAATLLNVKELIAYLKDNAHQNGELRQWLERLVNHWQQKREIKMLAWAYEAFGRIDPSIMPATHQPIQDLLERSDEIANRVLQTLQTRRDLRLSDLLELSKEIEYEESEWNQLKDFLGLLDPSATPMKLSANFTNTFDRLKELINIEDMLERLEDADLREPSRRSELENIDWMIKRDFEGFAIQQDLLKRVERLEPLTKLEALENRLIKAAEKCGSDSLADLYDMNCFPHLNTEVRELIEKFAAAGALDGAMWRKLSQEYCEKVYNKASIRGPQLIPPDLQALADRIDRLRAEEIEFDGAIDEMERAEPPVPRGGDFDPAQHREYLSLLPAKAPSSKRVELRFNRFTRSKIIQTILRQSRADLPDWVQKYVDEVIP